VVSLHYRSSRALLKSTKGVLDVTHGTLWQQSFNYNTPFRAAAIANPFNYLPAVSRTTIHGRNMSVNFAGFFFRFSFMSFVLC
jgi:hypothetical protein